MDEKLRKEVMEIIEDTFDSYIEISIGNGWYSSGISGKYEMLEAIEAKLKEYEDKTVGGTDF